jgi:hypothetical protein
MSSALDKGSIVVKSSTEETGEVIVQEDHGSNNAIKDVISLTNLRFRVCERFLGQIMMYKGEHLPNVKQPVAYVGRQFPKVFWRVWHIACLVVRAPRRRITGYIPSHIRQPWSTHASFDIGR